jgi:glycosyltransferase involved in cell wall biosynthesis
MLFSSGIGTVVRNVLFRLPELSAGMVLYGSDAEAKQLLEAKFARAEVQINPAPIYSVGEQVFAYRHQTPQAVFWSPHYNIPLAHGGPLVTTIHDTLHLTHPKLVGSWHKRVYARVMFRLAVRRSDKIICVSKFTRDELVRLVGADAAKITVVHNGVDDIWFSTSETASPHGNPYLLFVGNIKQHKNLRRLLMAFASLADEIPHDLVIIGQKEGLRSQDREVQKLGDALKTRVVFAGTVSDETLRQFYRHAALFVFPSFYEGFGLPPLEAMASGTPVAAAGTTALPEVCGDAAIYFDPFSTEDMAAAIKRVLDWPEAVREEKVRYARAHARKFTWEACARGTWQVLEAADREKRGGR